MRLKKGQVISIYKPALNMRHYYILIAAVDEVGDEIVDELEVVNITRGSPVGRVPAFEDSEGNLCVSIAEAKKIIRGVEMQFHSGDFDLLPTIPVTIDKDIPGLVDKND